MQCYIRIAILVVLALISVGCAPKVETTFRYRGIKFTYVKESVDLNEAVARLRGFGYKEGGVSASNDFFIYQKSFPEVMLTIQGPDHLPGRGSEDIVNLSRDGSGRLVLQIWQERAGLEITRLAEIRRVNARIAQLIRLVTE